MTNKLVVVLASTGKRMATWFLRLNRVSTSEGRAKTDARFLADKLTGVIAWSRTADPAAGEYGDPEELVRCGDAPEME